MSCAAFSTCRVEARLWLVASLTNCTVTPGITPFTSLTAPLRPPVKVCAAALLRNPSVNALYADETITRFTSADVGIAVATDRGLVVPVIRGAERLSISEIAAARADLVSRAREAKLQQADLEGGTFTISNLGMYGIRRFVAVINPPQAAILAVGELSPRPIVRDGEVVVRALMELTLTCDHRILYGADAAEFLAKIREYLEQPLRLAL